MIETTECFVHAATPKDDRLAAVTPSGGKRGMLIDAFYAAGVTFAPLSTSVSSELATMLGLGSIVGSLPDGGFAGAVDPSVYMNSIELMIDNLNIDVVVVDAELPKAPHELRKRTCAL
ncbi:acyl-CoA synthetase (NDP forming) [Bradyrhizobium sp. I1.7.5]